MDIYLFICGSLMCCLGGAIKEPVLCWLGLCVVAGVVAATAAFL